MHLASEPHAFPAVPSDEDRQYTQLLQNIRDTFRGAVMDGQTPLFTTAPLADLWERFLVHLPPERRQHYNCNACKSFVRRYGSLVVITPEGKQIPALWNPTSAPPFFRAAVDAMHFLVNVAPITGVFLASEREWGTKTDAVPEPPYEWHHMAVTPPDALVYRDVLLNAGQAMAKKREEYAVLLRGLADFSIDTVRTARHLLTTGALQRSEKCLGIVDWLIALHEARGGVRATRDRLTWRAVATAPTGYCHVRNTVVATLLEDIAKGTTFTQLQRRFNEKMDPLHYQRPQAAPAAGAIKQAEQIVSKLLSAKALDRRYAKLADIQTIWTPRPPKAPAPTPGVFGHIAPKGASKEPSPKFQVDGGRITWARFQETVLPSAQAIELHVLPGHGGYSAMVTAVNPEAPPILQWDRPEARNPVSWYFHARDSTANKWNLTPYTWVKVTAVAFAPNMWSDPNAFPQQGKKVFFLLQGCRDKYNTTGGGFFPEYLRSEYHSIRSVMEAYASAAAISGRDEASACGVALVDGKAWNCSIRVTVDNTTTSYILDRWV